MAIMIVRRVALMNLYVSFNLVHMRKCPTLFQHISMINKVLPAQHISNTNRCSKSGKRKRKARWYGAAQFKESRKKGKKGKQKQLAEEKIITKVGKPATGKQSKGLSIIQKGLVCRFSSHRCIIEEQ